MNLKYIAIKADICHIHNILLSVVDAGYCYQQIPMISAKNWLLSMSSFVTQW